MSQVNWNMAVGPDIGTHIYNSFQQGQQQGREERGRNALTAYALNPNDQTLAGMAQYDPKFVIDQRQAQAQKAQQDLGTVAKLLEGVTDEATYQQRLGMAKNMGIDTSKAPANFDPKWVSDTSAMFKLLTTKPEAMSTYGKAAMDAGFQPGTPGFQEFVLGQIRADAIKTIPYVPGGGVATFNPQTGQANVIVQPNYGQGPAGAPAAPAAPASLPMVNSPQEALRLPPGTRFRMPDGRIGTVPGGASSNAGGNFPGQ